MIIVTCINAFHYIETLATNLLEKSQTLLEQFSSTCKRFDLDANTWDIDVSITLDRASTSAIDQLNDLTACLEKRLPSFSF